MTVNERLSVPLFMILRILPAGEAGKKKELPMSSKDSIQMTTFYKNSYFYSSHTHKKKPNLITFLLL